MKKKTKTKAKTKARRTSAKREVWFTEDLRRKARRSDVAKAKAKSCRKISVEGTPWEDLRREVLRSDVAKAAYMEARSSRAVATKKATQDTLKARYKKKREESDQLMALMLSADFSPPPPPEFRRRFTILVKHLLKIAKKNPDAKAREFGLNQFLNLRSMNQLHRSIVAAAQAGKLAGTTSQASISSVLMVAAFVTCPELCDYALREGGERPPSWKIRKKAKS